MLARESEKSARMTFRLMVALGREALHHFIALIASVFQFYDSRAYSVTQTVIETYSKSSCAFLNDNYTLDLFNKGDERDAIDCLEQEFLAPWQRDVTL